MIANVIVRVPDVLTDNVALTETAYLALADALATIGVNVLDVQARVVKEAE